ncbi:MAG TPA: condensation domain-containing protein, partial [Pyrinomonadaceae bacterium]|nr:condensation domain-containing protein [Pyrinomonadaceae bacterium]
MTFDDSPSDVTEFSEEQRKLLAYLLEEEGVEFAEAQTIKPRPPLERLPLSFAQQRLWFLWRLEPERALYNISLPLRLRGKLGVAQLEQSINEIIARHEILRTVFIETEPEASQVVTPFVHRPLPVVDLTAFEDYEQRARELAAADAARTFDLQHGPLIRCTLLRAAAEHHFLLITMHHIVSDGWSLGVFMRELAAHYASLNARRPAPLPPLAIQYADYAYWQRETLRGATLEAELDFWKKQLDGVPPLLELPTDCPRPAVQTYNGAKMDFALPEELSEDVRRLTRRQGCTLFITLLAGFAALLHRYTEQDDVVVGFPVANRTSTETENLIGLFANTLLMRARFENQPTFMGLLEQVREAVLEAEAHQSLPI